MKISPRWQKRWLRLFILLSAAALRLFGLTSAPPGLTHDEAYPHGRMPAVDEAVKILGQKRNVRHG
ncbi:MAG: hypothetical protein AAGD96_32275 [Chloroflexota bacterium]